MVSTVLSDGRVLQRLIPADGVDEWGNDWTADERIRVTEPITSDVQAVTVALHAVAGVDLSLPDPDVIAALEAKGVAVNEFGEPVTVTIPRQGGGIGATPRQVDRTVQQGLLCPRLTFPFPSATPKPTPTVVPTASPSPSPSPSVPVVDPWTPHHEWERPDWEGVLNEGPAGGKQFAFYGDHPEAFSLIPPHIPTTEVYFGDWDGDGIATPAYREGSSFYFFDANRSGARSTRVDYGREDDAVYIGDWDGNGTDTIGVRRGKVFHLKNSIAGGQADVVTAYGREHDEVVIGNFDGNGGDTANVRRGNEFHLKHDFTGARRTCAPTTAAPPTR